MPEADPGRLARLTTTRDRLAEVLAGGPSARDLPALSREYRMVLREISAIDAQKEEADVIDQLATRRSAKTSRRAKRPS
jgi:hypothetical protein